jgi:isopenicillin N synthase-like dioxygenase
MTLPIVDISGLKSNHLATCQSVAAGIRQASHEVGFFYIKNHGIPQETIQSVFAQARRFFALPASIKEEVSMSHSQIARGYGPLRTQTLDLTMKPDLNESFYIGLERDDNDPLVREKLPNHGANQWPENLPGWRETMEAYFQTMSELSRTLARGLALSLDLDETYFDRLMDDPMPILRLLRYPPHPIDAPADEIGCGSHTDWGFLTILLQDEAGGLEVRNADGAWIYAEPIADTFVINLGDMMARWTNDYYQSTPHRVINNRSGKERYSVPFFWDINYHSVVECLPTCQSPDNPSKYPPIQAGDHIAAMYRQTYKKPMTL